MSVIASVGRRAIASAEELDVLCRADLLRLNFSHTAPADALAVAAQVRERHPAVRILQDLQGAKIRVGALPHELKVPPGERVVFVSESRYEELPVDRRGRFAIVPVATPFPFSRLAQATEVRMKDGTMRFRVEQNAAREGHLACVTLSGGMIRAEKGMNVPGVDRSGVGLPLKDLEDLETAWELRPDAICVSFVTGAGELLQARELIQRGPDGWSPELWAKVECREAIERIEEIAAVADVILIGQGDLAGELGPAEVHEAALEIARRARAAGRPVAAGTGLLESMRRSTVPRAEEIAALRALLEAGVTGFLLTAETTVGQHPGESIEALRRIVATLAGEA